MIFTAREPHFCDVWNIFIRLTAPVSKFWLLIYWVSFRYLRDGVTVETPDWYVHVVTLGIESGHVDSLGRHRHEDCHLVVFHLLPNEFLFTQWVSEIKHSEIIHCFKLFLLTHCIFSYFKLSALASQNIGSWYILCHFQWTNHKTSTVARFN